MEKTVGCLKCVDVVLDIPDRSKRWVYKGVGPVGDTEDCSEDI